jgi:HEAT repeat protein
MSEIIIGRKNWWVLLPFILIAASILVYRDYDRRMEIRRIQPFVINLQTQDSKVVAEALLEIRKSELYAEQYIDNIITLLGDQRKVPEEIKQRPDYYQAIPVPRHFRHLMKDTYIGDLAAAALVSIGSTSSGGLLYSEGTRQIEIQRRISSALVPVFRSGTSDQKIDAIRVINITRVKENLPVIADLLRDEDPSVRASALGLYISYAPLFNISPYMNEIEALTKDEDESVRVVASRVQSIVQEK